MNDPVLRVLVLAFVLVVSWVTPAAGGQLAVDYASLVSRADITLDKPVDRSEAGLPVGNGRMGSLVWTTPTALKMQINRQDVFASNSTSSSFSRGDTDYASGCGYVDINLVDYGEDVFAGKDFRQHLAVYEGLQTIQGKGLAARVLAWTEHDVMAIEVDDQRGAPSAISVDLRMLRYVQQYVPGKNAELAGQHAVRVQTGAHTATSRLEIRDGRIVLVQEFREGTYYNASAVVAGVVGRPSKARYENESTVRLAVAPAKGKATLLIASASTVDPKADVAALAMKELETAAARGFDGMLKDNQAWWKAFWAKSAVRLHSDDGAADFVEQNYTYFLYIMGSSSRGAYPPRFGGMLWYTTGDMRQWGAEYWWHNESALYDALPPTNRFELMDPMFGMYSRMAASGEQAARQQWGSQGLWLPETTWFDGLETLPEPIAAEMRDLYLMRKPWGERSQAFRDFAECKQTFNSRWNWINHAGRWENGRWVVADKGAGPFGHVTHIFSTTAKIAWLYWLRYEYTQDKAWLKDRAYPMIKGTVEFYRHFPNVKKGDDGKYHIYHVNNHEGIWDTQDAQEEVAAMRGMTPVLIRASEILDIDADLRPAWKEFAANLTPLATSDTLGLRKPEQPRVWMAAVPPARQGRCDRPALIPAIYYDLCTIGTEDAETVKTGTATYEAIRPSVNGKTAVSVLDQSPIAAANLGRADDLRFMLPSQIRCLAPEKDFCDWGGSGKAGVMANRLTLREGPGAIDCQRFGRDAAAMHAALLASVPPAPGKAPVLYVFPAWPKQWDAAYTLAARGGFIVSASMEKGKIEFVEIQSQVAGECRLHNPWGDAAVTLYRGGRKAEDLSGGLLVFQAGQGEDVTVVPQGFVPTPKKVQ
jgi:hypothetical protein